MSDKSVASDGERQASGTAKQTVVAVAIGLTLIGGGAGLVKVFKKLRLNKLLKEEETVRAVGISKEQLPKDLKGIFSAEKTLQRKGYVSVFVDNEKLFFPQGHTPSDQLSRHLDELDQSDIQQGVAIDEDLVSNLPFAEHLPEKIGGNPVVERRLLVI